MPSGCRAAFGAIGLAVAAAGAVAAQPATFRGRVLTDSAERPIAAVIVAIEAVKLATTTDSLGNFELKEIPPGVHVVTTRRVGFNALVTRVMFSRGATVDADLLLTPTEAQPLPGVKVEAAKPPPAKLAEFEERRLVGRGGRFLTLADIEKKQFATLGDALRQLPSLELRAGGPGGAGLSGREVYVVTGRMSLPACALCAGAGNAPCYAGVVLDGAFVYGAGGGDEPRFNINSLHPSQIAGIEYYVGPASMPIKYSGTRHTCGLIVIWTN